MPAAAGADDIEQYTERGGLKPWHLASLSLRRPSVGMYCAAYALASYGRGGEGERAARAVVDNRLRIACELPAARPATMSLPAG